MTPANGLRAKSGSKETAGSAATRARIVEATLETIRTEGIVGASARAIARAGDVNQASIYYHFGSINGAVLAALDHLSSERLDRYRSRLGNVSSLPELVDLARELHAEDIDNGSIRVMAQVMAGAAGDDEFGKEVAAVFDPWIEVVTESLERAIGSSPLVTGPMGSLLPVRELAFAISALFVGIEVLTRLGPDDTRGQDLFVAFEGVARLIDTFLRIGVPKASLDGAPG